MPLGVATFQSSPIVVLYREGGVTMDKQKVVAHEKFSPSSDYGVVDFFSFLDTLGSGNGSNGHRSLIPELSQLAVMWPQVLPSIPTQNDNESNDLFDGFDGQTYEEYDGTEEALAMGLYDSFKLLKPEQEYWLGMKIFNSTTIGERVFWRNLLVVHNRSLANWVVAKYYTRYMGELDELSQIGQEGLIRAAWKFDPSRGRFSTYATWWIKAMIKRFLDDHALLIHIPADTQAQLYRLRDLQSQWSMVQNEALPMEVIISELGLPDKKAALSLLATAVMQPIGFSQMVTTASPSNTIEEDVENLMANISHDRQNLTAEKYLIANDYYSSLITELQTILLALLHANGHKSSRWREVFFLYVGLDSAEFKPRTFERIARLIKMTSQRMRQLLTLAEGKIRRRTGGLTACGFGKELERLLLFAELTQRDHRQVYADLMNQELAAWIERKLLPFLLKEALPKDPPIQERRTYAA